METAWDTIIAGAGSAGCILAERLSEAPGRRVLLLEAGADYPEPHLLPPDIASGLRPTYSHDWGYFCEPGLVGRRFKLPRGKIVGGSSATNAAIALRGARSDYEPWEAAGGPAWSWREVLESFRRIENDLDFADPWHGFRSRARLWPERSASV